MPKILIVDDEVLIATQLKERLIFMGYTVVGIASSGEAAIDMARSLAPDLVLMDIVMPGNMDGIEAAKKIRGELNIPVTFLSAHIDNKLIKKAKLAEPFGYLLKPFNESEIKAAIEVALYKKDMEKRLQESEARYRSVFENTGAATIIVEEDGTLSMVNKETEKLSGYSKEELEGKMCWTNFIPQEDPERLKGCHVKRREDEGAAPTECELCMVDRHGKIKDISAKITIIPGTKKSVASLRDITERKLLESQLQHAQKMEAIGTLAGGIAHDFNNLLMGIQGNVSLALLNMEPDHPHYVRLNNVEQYVRSGAELTSQLLGFARGGKYEGTPTNLNELIKKSSSMFGRTRKEIEIHRTYQEDIWTVEVDQGQIEQTLLNLYVNAWQAMPGGGKLYLQTENVTLDENYVKPYDLESGRYVKISVTDTGVGMDKATKDKIFDPFFTTKERGSDKGTGLGLASAYGIIKNHHGFINIYSEEGVGTTFNICLPVSEAVVRDQREVVRQEQFLTGHETILLVDDEEMIINVSKEILKTLGYTVLTAGSGEEATAVYKVNRDKIGMVILDMIMPDMNGGKTYDVLKEINPDIKVLLSSGYSISGQATEILERGCDGFIQKPFNIEQLSQKIREILDK